MKILDTKNTVRKSLICCGLACVATTLSHAATIYTAPSIPTSAGGAMPNLSDGSDAFFTFGVNFTSFTFTDNTLGVLDHQILFESGGSVKGIALVLSSDGLLRFRSGAAGATGSEATVDLTSSGLSTGTDLKFVAAFDATSDTLDLYLNETSKTSTIALNNTELAGSDGYGVASFAGNNVGAFVSDGTATTGEEIEAFDFTAGTMTDFVVYDDLSEALATIPEPSTTLLGAIGMLLLVRRRR